MSIQIELTQLPNPYIEFGSPGAFNDPKTGLTEAGPFDLRFGAAHKTQLRIGLVGTAEMIEKGKRWLEQCSTKIPSEIKGSTQYMDFPGFKSAFHASLVFSQHWMIEINDNQLQVALTREPKVRFEEVLNLYAYGIERLTDETTLAPDIVMCCLPDAVVRKCWSISKSLTYRQRRFIKERKKERERGQLLLPFENLDIEETEEDLLNRDFRRALKARAMRFRMPIQIGTNNLFEDLSTNQDPAMRAWNMSVGLYYKAGGIPWRFKADGPETCFVGISFHHLRTPQRHLVYSSLAQAFSTSGDGFALRGDSIPWAERQDRDVHLTADQASNLARRVLQEYSKSTGGNPQRVVLHKTSIFDHNEQEGFRRAFHDVPIVELINVRPTRFRLLKYGAYPPKRGTLCTVNKAATYLFVTGYIPEWGTYPGPHVPVPIELMSDNEVDMARVASDILGLARMNWNTASISSGLPVTLFFSRRVGGIMAEVGEDQHPLPSFRYYM